MSRRLLNCWIDPLGDVYHVGLWGHSEFAAGRTGVSAENASEVLIMRGWARVATRAECMKTRVTVREMNDSQAVAIENLDGIDLGEMLPPQDKEGEER